MMTSKIKNNKKKQGGSALAIAVFIIVVMSLLATGISKSISSSEEQTVYEVFGTRALLAAESANEMALSQIFPLTGSGVCTASQNTYFNQNGLLNCVATTTCSSRDPDLVGTTYYQVISTGICKANLNNDTGDFSCGNEKICVSRSIEVEAKEL